MVSGTAANPGIRAVEKETSEPKLPKETSKASFRNSWKFGHQIPGVPTCCLCFGSVGLFGSCVCCWFFQCCWFFVVRGCFGIFHKRFFGHVWSSGIFFYCACFGVGCLKAHAQGPPSCMCIYIYIYTYTHIITCALCTALKPPYIFSSVHCTDRSAAHEQALLLG